MKKNPSHKKSQLSIFYISIIATVLILTMIVVNIGKIAKDKTYTANSADAGALAAASVMAFAFNYAANSNKLEEDKQAFEANYKAFQKAVSGSEATSNNPVKGGPYFSNAHAQYEDEKVEKDKTKSDTTCCPNICSTYDPDVNSTVKEMNAFIQQVTVLRDQVIPDYYNLQQKFIEEVRTRVHDDGNNGNDLYHIALSAGCKYSMFNSGFPVKMGEDSKMFFEFVDQECSPNSIQNGQAVTFTWADKAGRSHTVTSITSIDEAKTYKMIETKKNRQEVTQALTDAITKATQAVAVANLAKLPYLAGCLGCIVCVSACTPGDTGGDTAMETAHGLMTEAKAKVLEAELGVKKDENPKKRGGKADTKEYIIAYIEDIVHNRSVSASTFQKHQGGVIKSPRETPDTPTFYPPVQSNSGATFRGSGTIHPAEPKHDVVLTGSQ